MARVFLTAPFDASVFTDIVLPASQLKAGSLDGVRGGIAGNGVPWLVDDSGGSAQGHFADLDSDELSRLTHVAQVLGAPWRRIERRGEAVIVFASDEKLASAPHAVKGLSSMVAEAAREILCYRGRLSMPEIAARRHMILSRAWSRVTAQGSPPTTQRSAREARDVRVASQDTPHEGHFLTRHYRLRHPVFAGGVSDEVSREVFVVSDAALVLPYDPAADRLLLVEQFRMGPFGRGDPHPWVLEPVAGRIDPGESPEACALRECEEEARLALQDLEHISSHYCSPGCSTEFFHCYLGLCDLASHTAGSGGLESEHEDIATHILSFEETMALIRSGEINIGPLLLMLLWLERERPRLRAAA